jgi:NAD+ diphosphatase
MMTAGVLPPMGRSVFDRMTDRRLDAAWLADAWATAMVLLVTDKSATPVTESGLDLRPSVDVDPLADRFFLGVHAGVHYFAVRGEGGDGWQGPRDVGPRVSPLELDLLITAVALVQWHSRHPHCPLCGAATEIDHGGWTRRCPVDESQHFPRNDPAVIMLIHDGGDRCLLGRGHQWGAGRYSTLAGFVDAGESLESAVAREVFEEVGVRVTDIRYAASQPWPFPSSLMLGYTARLDGSDELHPDGIEVVEAGWFTREEVRQAADWTDENLSLTEGPQLRAVPPQFSISRFLIDGWVEGRLG